MAKNNPCCVCDRELGMEKLVFTAEGHIYCSAECGIYDFTYVYGKDAKQKFNDALEMVVGEDIGIPYVPHRKYKFVITGRLTSGKRFKPIYTDEPWHYNIYSGTLWAQDPWGNRKLIWRYIA